MEELKLKLTENGRKCLEDSKIGRSMLIEFSDQDIKDLFSEFKDRFYVRKFIANEKEIQAPVQSDLSFSPCSNAPSNSDTDSGTPTAHNKTADAMENGSFTAEEFLEKKGFRKSSNKAQSVFRSILRDSALAAHIWQKAPTLIEIPGRKREAFFTTVHEQAPQLKNHQTSVWKRLGEHLQNRRKYLLDKSKGKRGSAKKSSGFPTANEKSPNRKTQSPFVRKSPRVTSPRVTSPSVRKSPRATTSSSVRKSPVARNVSFGTKSTGPRKSLFENDPKISSTSARGTETGISPGDQVSILSKLKEVLGTGIVLLDKTDENHVFGEVVLTSKSKDITNVDESDLELYEQTKSGATSFTELNINENFLWKMDLLKPKLNKSSHGTGKERKNLKQDTVTIGKKKIPGFEQSGTDDQSTNDNTDMERNEKVVLMEWNGGEIYAGLWLKEEDKVISCKQPICRITDFEGSCYRMFCKNNLDCKMLELNHRDVQNHPDKDFLVWMPPLSSYKVMGKKCFTIQIQGKNHAKFIKDVCKAVECYLV